MTNITTPCLDHGLKGCHLGYGRTQKSGKNYLLHRLAFCKAKNLHIDDIKGQLVLHECDNPRCINPQHLRLGTNADNMRDMSIKGRAPGRKLTAEQVLEIRAICKPNKPCLKTPNPYSYRELARKYGVDMGTIRQVHLRKTFKHLPEGETV